MEASGIKSLCLVYHLFIQIFLREKRLNDYIEWNLKNQPFNLIHQDLPPAS